MRDALEAAFIKGGARLHEETWHVHEEDMPAIAAALAARSEPDDAKRAAFVIDANRLGMAMDLVDEEDSEVGVLGRGRKVDRIITKYLFIAGYVDGDAASDATLNDRRTRLHPDCDGPGCICGQWEDK